MAGFRQYEVLIPKLVPAVFLVAANGVGLFDSSDETNKVTYKDETIEVEQGSKVELPFWLARELHLRQALSINLPPCFNQKVGDKTIALLLLAAFQTRYKEVLIKAQTAAMTVAPKFLTLLTKEETKIVRGAQSSMVAFKKWRMGGPRFQRASVLGRKRRPSD
ncbi:GINS complex protein [Actinidia rufa]|uniref:GINS complex protein n=1 Tax=Actinidia rufa TaxID=165716 RepID=A0A7J0FNG2_9ERIC|nr:GINS complex protein [Actinidia rufa]